MGPRIVRHEISDTLPPVETRRLEDWDRRLNDYLRTVGPFAWGTNDCCLFAANGVQAMTGIDFAEPYRGYSTARGALEKLGTDGIEGVATKAWGSPKNAAYAQRGDPVLIALDDGEKALGLCIGTRAASVGQGGIVMLPMSRAILAWSI